MARVLVTRPEPGATRTAQKLQEMGHKPLVLPLTAIVPLRPQWPAGQFDAVLATSANAFLFDDNFLKSLFALPIHVVGSKTAEAARTVGFSKNGIVASDVSTLLAGLSGTCWRGSRLLYLCGRVRRRDLEDGLFARGYSIVAVETYDTNTVSYLTEKVVDRAGPDPLDVVLVMSGEAANAMRPFLLDARLTYLFDKAHFICISDRVAGVLEPLCRGRLQVAETPDEAAILKAINN